MPKCFVIHPFDDGKQYDKRYEDVFAPAIKDADLEPYRVDRDLSVSVPIDENDHIVARSKGGPDTDDNLQLLCPPGNRRKGSKTMRRFLELLDTS